MAEPPEIPAGAAVSEGFGDYVLVKKIAQGGMAELFLAKRRGAEGFEKTVAVKRILPELSWNRDFVTMFINEAKIAARLSHPNIVQIFDFGKVDNYYFIAMEFVHGENLRAILGRATERQVPLPQDLAALIAARACAGLEHAHKKTDEAGRPLRIIHRDVSPQNVLVSYEGDIKVVDFGIAKAVAESPEATRGVLKGKLAYLSPEQILGKNLDARSDVFAMGAVLYELLAGQKLFDHRDTAEALDAIVRVDSTEVSRRLSNVHRSLREVLRRALHADAEQRFQSAGEMQQALENYLHERGDPGGTLQLTNYMRLLFDERIGEATQIRLRAQLFGPERGPRSKAGWPAALPPRVTAAVGGGMLALVALAIAAPELRIAAKPPAAPPAARVPDAPSRPAPPPGPESKAEPGSGEITRATSALGAGDAAQAVASFEKAFAADPGLRAKHSGSYARALSEDGKRLFEEGSDAAGDRFRAAIKADPDLFEPHFFLAKIATRRKDAQAALREYREAIRINPASADAQFNLGFIYFTEKLYDDALRQYERVVELRPPYLADVFYNIAACYEQMGKKSDAVKALRRGVEAVPDNELLRQRLKQLGG